MQMDDAPEEDAAVSADERVVPSDKAGSPARAELDRLFNMSLDLLCIAGLDGYFKHVNPAFVRTLGYRHDDLLRKAFIEFVHPDDHESTLAEVAKLAEGIDVVDFENRYLAADGSWRWLAWRSTSVPEEGLIFAVARDVTGQKKLEELAVRQAAELARSNADLEQFAAIASHDLRAPLRAVSNLADWIEEELPADVPDAVAEYLQALRDRVDLMSQLVADLLAYSRVGRDIGATQVTDTAALVSSIAELLGPPEGFDVVKGPGLPVFETARSALEQVLRNLIANAMVHHDRRTGRVTVSAKELEGFWEFSVADDGPGIPQDDRENVFEMLWSATADGDRGTGMGLALVRRIVERVGGRVVLRAGESRGTTFRFIWPARIVA